MRVGGMFFSLPESETARAVTVCFAFTSRQKKLR